MGAVRAEPGKGWMSFKVLESMKAMKCVVQILFRRTKLQIKSVRCTNMSAVLPQTETNEGKTSTGALDEMLSHCCSADGSSSPVSADDTPHTVPPRHCCSSLSGLTGAHTQTGEMGGNKGRGEEEERRKRRWTGGSSRMK